MSIVVIVDESDKVISTKDFASLTPRDIYRVSALWLTNSKGDVLLAQRAFTKTKDPGAWGPAAAGTLEEGESYDSNIIKEIREEIGLILTINDLTHGPKLHTVTEKSNYFGQWYLYTLDRPAEQFVLQKEEVERVAWFSKVDLYKEISENPKKFTPSAPQWIKRFL